MNDYNAAAHTCAVSKAAEPRLKLAITKGARPEIAENPYYSTSFRDAASTVVFGDLNAFLCAERASGDVDCGVVSARQ